MDDQIFKTRLTQMLRDLLPEDTSVTITAVRKNNNAYYDAVLISSGKSGATPVIYLDQYYERWKRGTGLLQIAREMIGIVTESGGTVRKISEVLADPEQIRTRIVRRLVGRSKNRAFLEEVPHVPFMDLAVVFSVLMDGAGVEGASLWIRHEHLKQWGISREELLSCAEENTMRLEPPVFAPMYQMIGEILGSSQEPEQPGEVPLYILTNQSRCYGAVWMTDRQELQKIGEKIGQDFYLLPSSVHECIVLSAGPVTDEEGLALMVREINETVVSEEEVLSDSIYRYDYWDKQLKKVQET